MVRKEQKWPGMDVSAQSFALREYKANPHNPDIITAIWRKILPDFQIPGCDWTESEIAKPMLDINGQSYSGVMVPLLGDLQGKKGLIRLGRAYPKMKSFTVQEGTPIVSDELPTGWGKIENTVRVPHRGAREDELRDFFRSSGLVGQTEGIYILGSQFSKLTSGKYFDDDCLTTSLLLGSHLKGQAVRAGFDGDGILRVGWFVYPRFIGGDMGGRSMEMKRS